LDNPSSVLQIAQELSGQWTLPILLSLEDCGGRYTPLQRQLGIAPARLGDNLRRMIQLGLIQYLSAYERRHPLFPEYTLTDKGRMYREAAKEIERAEKDIGRGRLSVKAWNIPVLLTLDLGYHRFQEIRMMLKPVTPRMLSVRLNELTENGTIVKQISEQPRPAYVYDLSELSRGPAHHLSISLCALL
jgi:DNA-binding HxlR family transcriptional regulator